MSVCEFVCECGCVSGCEVGVSVGVGLKVCQCVRCVSDMSEVSV